MTRRFRRLISVDHADRGEDIVADGHGAIMAAVIDPASAGGPEHVGNFRPRTRDRGADAGRVEVRDVKRHMPLASGDDEVVPPRGHRLDRGPGSVEVSHLLGRIGDPRGRLAFRLLMEGMRVRGGNACVPGVFGCDPKTAGKGIAEARAVRAAEIGARRGRRERHLPRRSPRQPPCRLSTPSAEDVAALVAGRRISPTT